MSKQALVVDIIAFLKASLSDGTVASDDKESLEIAIDAITESFKVSDSDLEGANDLQSLWAAGKVGNGQNGGSSLSSGPATPGNSVFGSYAESVFSTPKEVTPEEREHAEQLKIEGNRQMARKEYENAAESYTKAIEIDPRNVLYFSNRAAAYTQMGKATQAVQDARTAVSLDPTYSKAYSRLGLALYSVGDTKGALDAYEQGLRAEGDSPSEGMQRGYKTVQKRLEAETAHAKAASPAAAPETPSSNPLANLGNLAGGLGGFTDLMKNPEIQKLAQGIMSNPTAVQELLNNPTAQKLRESFATGGAGDFLNSENIQNMVSKLSGSGQN